MNRPALEHILRAASAVADVRDIVVIGSQSILGQFPDAPHILLASVEADVYPRDAPERSDLIDGAIGELRRRAQPLEPPEGPIGRRTPFGTEAQMSGPPGGGVSPTAPIQ